MNVRAIGVWSLLVVSGLASAAAYAAQPAATEPSVADVLQAVKTMSARVEQLSSDLQGVKSELTVVQQQLSSEAQTPQGRRAVGAGSPTESTAAGQYVTKAEFDRLQTELQDLVQIAKDRSDLLETVVADISTSGGSGHSIADVRAIMEDPAGRKAMDQAVHGVMKRSGTLVVENRMDSNYRLLLNNETSIDIGPHETKRIPVGVGTITTELVGFESVKSWSIGPPNYEQSIVIGPKPVQPVVITAPPSYYWDPLWGWVAVQ
jgi:hypothetical protein